MTFNYDDVKVQHALNNLLNTFNKESESLSAEEMAILLVTFIQEACV